MSNNNPGRAADSPANGGPQPGTAWPGAASGHRAVQIGIPMRPPTVSAVLTPGNPYQAQGGHPEAVWSLPAPEVTVSAVAPSPGPGQPLAAFLRSVLPTRHGE